MALVTKQKRGQKTPDKRRTGRHHKRDGHYLKAYWPYLPLALVIGIGIFANALLNLHQHGVLGYATDVSTGQLLADTNTQRGTNGLGALTPNATLNQAAQAKANDMVARDYWSHNTPDGNTPWTFFVAAGYQYQTAGENLAYGFDTSGNTVTAWMNSPEHRANILNTTYSEIGFGIANSANYQGTGPETVVVALYASPHAATVAAAAPSQPAAAPAAAANAQAAQNAPIASDTTKNDQPIPEANATPAPKAAASGSARPDAASKTAAISEQPVTRIQLLATNKTAPWSVFAVSAVATVGMAVFLLRHSLAWHRVLVKSERFVLRHKLLDIVLISIAVLGVLLTRTVGMIR